MNILIAEDEDNIALALKAIVSKAVDQGNIVTVSDGQEALKNIEEGEYNLVISDWNMPRMTGLELLDELRSRKETAQLPFLMLTARADIGSVKAALGSGVTDYISKPFDKDSIVEKIKKFLPEYIKEKIEQTEIKKKSLSVIETVSAQLRNGEISFPVLPEVGFKAVEVINAREVALEEVADIIEADAGLTSRIIAVANSSYYRPLTPIQELHYAIGRIGLRDVGNIVLMFTTRRLFSTSNPVFKGRQQLLWEHSLATAEGARVIGRKIEHPFPERLYAMGMLHDMGKVTLIHVLSELSKVRGDVTEEAIDKTLDQLHTLFGEALLKRWEFPSNFVEVAGGHHDYDQMGVESLDIQLVAFADLLSRTMGMSMHEMDEHDTIMSELAEKIGVQLDQLDSIKQDIVNYVSDIKKMI